LSRIENNIVGNISVCNLSDKDKKSRAANKFVETFFMGFMRGMAVQATISGKQKKGQKKRGQS
jgi:hypothetical protein